MISRFFIYRPIFAVVVSIVIVLIGAISLLALPIEQTPNITPPTVSVEAVYPGASAEVIAETVAIPIENEIIGVDNMIYMSSKSANDGTYTLTVSFEVGTDIDMATVLVQNRVSIAEPRLPEEVKRQGVTTKKKSTNLVLIVSLYSPGREFDELYQSNYINTQIIDVIKRVPGVGEVTIFGAKDFGMRVWLDPERLKARDLTTNDVVNSIREQNVQVAAGQIGAPPAPVGTNFTYTINTQGRLTEVSEFEDLIVKVGAEGQLVRLKDVARVELGAENYRWSMALNGQPSIGLGIYQLPGANALDVAAGVESSMERLSQSFPPGLEYDDAFDTTRYIAASISEVVETLLIAVLLVVITVYLFLQDFRTTLIPAVTIPVALIGTFFVMAAMGISINTLSLFGIVLAIGIVVDDAIVVVENTMRLIDEEGLGAREATVKAMEEITGPVVATTLVLLAVFVPTAMLGGITGRLYQQFAITISVATVFSSINALTLSPALCGLLLRPTPKRRNFLFRGFERMLEGSRRAYGSVVALLVRRLAIPMVFFVGVAVATGFGMMKLPTGFIPEEDQGYFYVNATLPDGASLERTEALSVRLGEELKALPGIADVITFPGFSILDSVVLSNALCVFVTLEPWDDRSAEEEVSAILQRLNQILYMEQAAFSIAFSPPAISGLGTAGGFEFQVEDQSGMGLMLLETVATDMLIGGSQDPALDRMNNNFRATTPQIYLDVDREKVMRLGIPLQEVFSTLQAALGSAYVNDFNIFGRTYKVYAQADHRFRNKIEDINRLEVRDATGNMIPMATLVTISETVGPQTIFRYNNYPSALITGSPAPGFSSGQAIASLEALAGQVLPLGMGFEWTGISKEQIDAGSPVFIFAMALIFVFLFLAAQYESWSTPLAVLLNVPFAILGAVLLTSIRQFDNNVFTQIGFVLLIGLSSKNAILIVEFAKQGVESGKTIIDAAMDAARLRFRAILMTAISFILGVIPLVLASGAGANSRQSLGTAVFGGMLLATCVGIFMIPPLYVFVATYLGKKPKVPSTAEAAVLDAGGVGLDLAKPSAKDEAVG